MPDRRRPQGEEGDAQAASTATLVHSIAVRFAIFGMNAVTGIVTARVLSPDGRGELAAISLWPLFIAGLTTMGLQSALVYHGRRSPAHHAELTAAAMTLTVGTGAIGTWLGWHIVPMWLDQHPAWVVRAAQYCLFGILVNALTLTGRAAWEARGDFRASNLSQLLPPVLTILSLGGLWAAGRLTPATAGAAYIGAGIPVLIWMFVSLGNGRLPFTTWSPGLWRRLLHYGMRSYGVDVASVLAVYLDQALVVSMLAPAVVGVYAVALSLSKIISAVHVSVSTMMFPRTVGMDDRTLTGAIARSARLGALVTGAIGLGVVMTGPVLVRLLYGPDYGEVGPLLPLLVVYVVLAGIAQILLQGLLAAGRPAVAAGSQFLALAVSLPLFLTLVPQLGARGAALALVISTAIRTAVTMACYPLALRTPVPSLWIGRADLAALSGFAQSWARTLPLPRLRVGEAE